MGGHDEGEVEGESVALSLDIAEGGRARPRLPQRTTSPEALQKKALSYVLVIPSVRVQELESPGVEAVAEAAGVSTLCMEGSGADRKGSGSVQAGSGGGHQRRKDSGFRVERTGAQGRPDGQGARISDQADSEWEGVDQQEEWECAPRRRRTVKAWAMCAAAEAAGCVAPHVLRTLRAGTATQPQSVDRALTELGLVTTATVVLPTLMRTSSISFFRI